MTKLISFPRLILLIAHLVWEIIKYPKLITFHNAKIKLTT